MRKTRKKKPAINMRRYFTVLGVSLAIIIAITFFGMSMTLKKPVGEETEPVITAPVADGKINVLLMGVDQEGYRTDAIMLASYDTETNQVQMLSIPRDTRMYVGSKYQKINAAHAITGGTGKIAGPQGTIEAVSRLTGVPINYYVEFSFDSIADIMDSLGPVTFDVPDIVGGGKGMVYDDPAQNLHINIPAGVQELNGEQIVHLLRFRKGNYDETTKSRPQYANGDIGRISMQQEFLKALVDQKLNASLILKIPAIFKEVSSGLKTNFTVGDIVKYSGYLTNFSSTGLNAQSLPGRPSGDEYDASYWICDLDATRLIIQNDFGYDASSITIDKVAGTSTDTGEKKQDDQKNSSNKDNKPKKTTEPKATKKPSSSKETKAPTKVTTAPKKTTAPTKAPAATKSPSSTKTPQKSNEGTTSSATKTPTKTSIPVKGE